MQDFSFVKNRYEPCYTKIKNFDKLKRKNRQPVIPGPMPQSEQLESSCENEEDVMLMNLDGFGSSPQYEMQEPETAKLSDKKSFVWNNPACA